MITTITQSTIQLAGFNPTPLALILTVFLYYLVKGSKESNEKKQHDHLKQQHERKR